MNNFITLSILLFPLFADVDYESEIQPIFSGNCGGCHLSSSSAGLNLSSYDGVMTGSNNGAVVIPYDHAASVLWQRVNNGSMPPNNNDLTSAQVQLIADWIDEGAQSCVIGCTDPAALNYFPDATCDDGSCLYPEDVDYESEIQPIFDNSCISCHGYSGGLNLTSYDNLMAGGNSGDVIVPGNNSESLLWTLVNSGVMPQGPTPDLTPFQVNLIAIWIDEGALPEPGACALPGDINGDLSLNVLDRRAACTIISSTGPAGPAASSAAA